MGIPIRDFIYIPALYSQFSADYSASTPTMCLGMRGLGRWYEDEDARP